MAFWWLEAAQSLQQIALLTNTAIHVLMYYYYFMCSIKRPPRWKKLVTQSRSSNLCSGNTCSNDSLQSLARLLGLDELHSHVLSCCTGEVCFRLACSVGPAEVL